MTSSKSENRRHEDAKSLQNSESATQNKIDCINDGLSLLSRDDNELLSFLSTILKDDYKNKTMNIKQTLEDEMVSLHGRFIQGYRTNVIDAIDLRLKHIETLEDIVTEAIDKITVNRERIENVIRRSSETKASLDHHENRTRSAAAFRDLFVIDTSATDNVLVSGTNLESSLLDYADLIEKKRSNCRKLLDLVPNAQLAIESLNQSVKILELLYEKIFLAIKSGGSPSPSPASLNRALLYLQERPHMFEQAVTSISRVRGDNLGQKFLTLLRNGLESTAFDTVRFVSDMMSWLLEQLIYEQSFFESIFHNVRSSDSLIPTSIDSSFTGVLEMISIRFDSSLEQTYSVIDLFKLSRVMDFYSQKFHSSVGESCLADIPILRKKCWTRFNHQWETRVQEARSDDSSSSAQHISALQPIPFVTETAFLLDSLLDIYTDGCDSDVEAATMDDEIFSLLSSSIDPLVQLCLHVSTTSMSRIDGCVYFLNCLSSIQAPLKKYTVAEHTMKNLDTLIDSQMEVLVTEITQLILKRVGLLDKLHVIDRVEQIGGGREKVLAEPEFHPIGLASSLKGFYSTLFTQGISASSGQIDLLLTRDLRLRARQTVSKNIADAYEKIFQYVNGESLRGVASHTPDQVRALLDVV